MQTSGISPTPAAPAATSPAAAAPAQKSVISSDFNTFLKMLTTQIKNQDPTNPMDSSDFAVQLATFSGVEQQVRTNDMLGTLSSQFGVMGMSQLAAWVGQEARAPGPVYLGDSPVTVTYASAAGADRAVLVARDGQGNVMGREDVALGKGPHQWQGYDAQGQLLPKGQYALSLESYKGGVQVGPPSEVQAYSRILEARSGASGTMLVLEGGIEVAATAVTALRVAGSNDVGTAPDLPQAAPPPQDAASPPSLAPEPDLQPAPDTPSALGGETYQDIWGSDAPPSTLDQLGQPEPETYRPD